jgi:hypothetical protein
MDTNNQDNKQEYNRVYNIRISSHSVLYNITHHKICFPTAPFLLSPHNKMFAKDYKP